MVRIQTTEGIRETGPVSLKHLTVVCLTCSLTVGSASHLPVERIPSEFREQNIYLGLHSRSKANPLIQQLFVECLLCLSIIVDTGDTAVIKTHRLPVLMEMTAGKGDRESITSICIHAYVMGNGVGVGPGCRNSRGGGSELGAFLSNSEETTVVQGNGERESRV